MTTEGSDPRSPTAHGSTEEGDEYQDTPDSDVPLARQCCLPTCENEAVDPSHGGALCESHLNGEDDAEPVTDFETSDDSDTGTDTSKESDIEAPRHFTVPAPLDELGEAFVPIPPGEKGTRRPRTPENLFAPDDDVLEAYLEAGHNFGVVCRNDLAVVDADEPEALRELLEALPETAWQISGSRSSEHHFLIVPGLDEDLPLVDPDSGEELGHIKGAEQSYVVGPGSRHPSGNRYGPLVGETIAIVDESRLRELIDPFRPDGADRSEGDHTPIERAARSGGNSGHDLDVYDVLSSGSYPAESRCEHPFHGSSTGANFMVDGDSETWRCWRHDCTGNVLHLVGIDEGVISCGDWKHGGLSTDTWREIFAAAREAGYDLPDRTTGDDAEPVAVLPGSPVERATRFGGLSPDRRDQDADPIQERRDRTTDEIADAYRSRDRALIEALPTLGKTYGEIAAAAETDTPISVLTTRGRKEQYAEIEDLCEQHGLSSKTLPAFTHHCETANGTHGEEWADTVRGWYHSGATPKQIHKYAEDVLGHPLPCQEHEGQRCRYAGEWDFDPDEYDVLIGHYTHAHKRKITSGRAVVFDEFPGGAFETTLAGEHELAGAVSTFLDRTPQLPFEDYADLLEHRHDDEKRADALAYLVDDLEPDPHEAFDGRSGHAYAPLAVFTLLAAEDLGNGRERATFPDGDPRIGVYDREANRIHIRTPPALDTARAVVALDGTPTPELWELAIDERLNHRQVLVDGEREEYLEDILGLQIIRTTEAVKPYAGGKYVNTARDMALLETIRERHGTAPGVITSYSALETYDDEGVLDLERSDGVFTGDVLEGPADQVCWYGNVLGSNEFKHTRVGAVIGSNHYGDGFIKKWGAYAGEAVERDDGKGTELSYGEFGDRILTHMREHDTLQAAMRFGRDGNGAVVYVHTNTLPDWVPLAGEGRVIKTWSDGMRAVIDALQDLETPTTAEIADHPAVDVDVRQVFDHLESLREQGVLERRQDDRDGRRVVWLDEGIARLNDHGDVELCEVSLDELGAEEVRELARSSIYTWEFMNLAGQDGETAGDPVGEEIATDGGRPNGGDPPPNDVE